ncbi:MAG: aryl-sulfate sulfotransferase [Gemmatimonadota bacterium]
MSILSVSRRSPVAMHAMHASHIAWRVATVVSCMAFAACHSDGAGPPAPGVTFSAEQVTLNPSGYAPLTARIHVESSTGTKVAVRVAGKHGATSDVRKAFDLLDTAHDVPILGLYPNSTNTVELTFTNASGTEVGQRIYTIATAPLLANTFPQITIDSKQEGMFAPGMTLVSYFGYGNTSSPQRPFIFDEFGDIRWYLDYASSPSLANLFYDDGVERLQNGNFYFGDGSSNRVYEIDGLGQVVNSWPLPGYQFHHEVQEKPNGNFLVTVSKQGATTVEDFVIEIDRTSKAIVRTWDLRTSLQYGRRTLTGDAVDWVHINAVAYDASDNTIIVSGRTQGVVKLDADNHVVWILGAHRGWGTAGDGTDLRDLLLQPLDRNGAPIADADVLDGSVNHPDFEWNWYQHAPLVMPNGHVMLFDNGDNRNFGGSPAYSRAVEFAIDPAAKTVRQVWAYGKARGAETYSRIVSDVDFLSTENHVIFSPGAVNRATNFGKVVEMDYVTQGIVFEATITPPIAQFGITLHRTERVALYP